MMNKFFNYYDSLCVGANTPTVFAFDPYVTAIKELFVSELQQIVFYIEKLKKLEIDMSVYTDKVIEFISILIVNLDFRKESFFVIMEDLYNNKKMLEKMYISACEKANKKPELILEPEENYSSREIILKALNEKEKNIQEKFSKIKVEKNKKNLYEIMINLVFNACNCLIELKNLKIDFPEAKNEVLKLLNTTNFPDLTDEDLISVIKNFSKCNYKIMQLLYSTIIEKYGPVSEINVPLRKKKGKAILVSGNSFLDLEKILTAVDGLNINVYTHHEMISAFQYKEFNKFTNLVGHYQKSDNNFQLDFASFPGPIYISGNAVPKIDVIRGQIYTSEKYPAFGIAKIENNNFEPLINYALDSKGFDKDKEINKIKIGYNESEINEKINLISDKFQNKEIKKVFIIGLIYQFNQSNEYINEFLKNCPIDNYIISFSYNFNRENIWHVNSYFDFSVVYKIIEKLTQNIPTIKDEICVFITDCNTTTIAHIFNFIYLDIKNIFLGPCCPNIINPVLIDGLSSLFYVKSITNAVDDINSI